MTFRKRRVLALVPARGVSKGVPGKNLRSLAADDALRSRMGGNAAEDARVRFGLDNQASAYLDFYSEMRERGDRPD